MRIAGVRVLPALDVDRVREVAGDGDRDPFVSRDLGQAGRPPLVSTRRVVRVGEFRDRVERHLVIARRDVHAVLSEVRR
jgi:hypothetical protein